MIDNKVTAAALAAAASTVLGYLISAIFQITIPEVVLGAITTILVFAAGYIVPSQRLQAAENTITELAGDSENRTP